MGANAAPMRKDMPGVPAAERARQREVTAIMMHFIFGGIHLDGRKEGTQRKALAELETAPERVVIPLSMHAGTPCVPVVAPGDRVAVGQPIARAEDESMFVHASVSGRVEDVGPRPDPMGGTAQAVVIRNDGEDTPWNGGLEPVEDCLSLAPEEIVRRIRLAGVTGMGGGGYPAAAKLTAAAGRVDTVIVNALESEPYVTADHRLLLERGEEVLTAVKLLMRAVGARHGVVAVEGNKLNAAEALERRLLRNKLNVRVVTVPSRYPLGAEKQVIKAVTGREVPPENNAIDVGCVVFNAATAYAVYQAAAEGRALTHRVVTVTGAAVVRPRNLWVPIGTPMTELVKGAGGFREKPDLVLVGGPMMGRSQVDMNAPVVKNTNSVICMLDWEHGERPEERVCIRCGRCVSVCPMHLMPLLVDRELKLGGDVRELRRLNTQDCLGCGCCAYICPSSIPLVERMSAARQRVAQEREKGSREVAQ